jgi:hypothetical protein
MSTYHHRPRPESVDRAYHKILESVKSDSVPRGSWSRSTATGAGQGGEYRLVCVGSRHARLSIFLLLPSRSQILSRFCLLFPQHYEQSHFAWPDPFSSIVNSGALTAFSPTCRIWEVRRILPFVLLIPSSPKGTASRDGHGSLTRHDRAPIRLLVLEKDWLRII